MFFLHEHQFDLLPEPATRCPGLGRPFLGPALRDIWLPESTCLSGLSRPTAAALTAPEPLTRAHSHCEESVSEAKATQRADIGNTIPVPPQELTRIPLYPPRRLLIFCPAPSPRFSFHFSLATANCSYFCFCYTQLCLPWPPPSPGPSHMLLLALECLSPHIFSWLLPPCHSDFSLHHFIIAAHLPHPCCFLLCCSHFSP